MNATLDAHRLSEFIYGTLSITYNDLLVLPSTNRIEGHAVYRSVP